jgi:hypothetical protein
MLHSTVTLPAPFLLSYHLALQVAALAVLSFAVATYLIYMKFPGVLGGLLLGEV